MDDAGDEIKTIQCVYQGENVCPGDAFSTDQVFEVGSDLAYKAEVFCEKVSFTDDTVWRTNETANVYEVERLELNQFPRFRYLFDAYNDILFNRGTIKKNKRGTVDAGSKRRPMYFPVKDEKNVYWTCTCGMPVEMNRPCPVCKCTFEELQDIFSQQYLQKKQHDTVLKRAAERAKETCEFRESLVRKEEEKKAEQYKKALAAEKSDSISQLTDAVKILEQLGDYQEAGAKSAEYGERIEALKAEEAKRQKELEEKRREEYNKRLLEEEKARNRRTKGLILAVVVLIAVLAFAFIRHYFDPYQKVHRYILEYGKQDSDKRKITVKEDDILFGAYTMSLVASDHERKPFWIELSYQDTSKKRCKGEVEFRPSYVSLDVETVFDSLPVINDFDYHMNYSGRATLYCSADLSHLKEDDWYKYLKINGVWADGGYHDYVYDGLKGTSPEGEPEIQNMLAEAVFLSMRSLENILEDNDIKVTMEDLGLTSLNLTKGSTLYYWLDMNGLNVSTEDLGFNM